MLEKEDPLIRLLKTKPDVLKLLGRVWDILYIEGRGPEVGKRRENFIIQLLRREFNLQINTPESSVERGWDFSVVIEREERKYSLKTYEEQQGKPSTIKVAWNGFPSIEKARTLRFEHPILYILRDKTHNQIFVYLFEVTDLEELKKELGDNMWWIPRRNTNPRGFGINPKVIPILMQKAKQKGNFIFSTYPPIDINKVVEDYWGEWYNMLKKIAMKDQPGNP
jgi:hypothetical protein